MIRVLATHRARHDKLYSEGLTGITSMPCDILEVFPPAPYLSPLALVYQEASLPRSLTPSAPARLSPWPGTVGEVPSRRRKECHQTSVGLGEVGEIQSFTHLSSGRVPFLGPVSLEKSQWDDSPWCEV